MGNRTVAAAVSDVLLVDVHWRHVAHARLLALVLLIGWNQNARRRTGTRVHEQSCSSDDLMDEETLEVPRHNNIQTVRCRLVVLAANRPQTESDPHDGRK